MTCRWRNQDSDTLLQCMALTPIFAEADVSTYASRVGADGPDGPYGYVYWYAVSCLRINRLIRPNIPEGPCGNTRRIPTGPELLFGEVTKLSYQDPEPISQAVIQGIGEVGSFFSHIFSGAPTQHELQVQCDTVNGYNAFADALESALQSGQLGIQDALIKLKAVHDQLSGELATVHGGKDFATYSLQKAVDALFIFNNEVVLPNITTAGLDSASVPILAVGGIFAAKLFGVF